MAPIPGGVMGEVYRARDSRLSRDVAVKVLPEELAANPDRLDRFEREARAISALNHPNIVTVHDIGRCGALSYMALELVEGQTLRALMRSGALPFRRVLDLSAQIADGLAAAHGVGIVHRDLKPENLMVTKDGRVKILDFGLAKIVAPIFESPTDVTVSVPPAGTVDGTLLGTIVYMSPEQASGRRVDTRSDLFAFGSILYELWTGRSAFAADSPAETITAVIRDEPELPRARTPAEEFLRHILQRCLAKAPEGRYAATADLASDLKHAEELSSKSESPAPPPHPRAAALIWVFLLLLAVAAAIFAGSRLPRAIAPSYRQLTFRRGTIWSARFAQGGNTIVYSAAWDGEPFRLFRMRPENPDSESLNFPDAEILSVSKGGEMLASLGARGVTPGGMTLGLLAQAPLEGGTPRELLQNVTFADWAPNGSEFAVVRSSGGRSTLEFPRGKKIYETAGFVSHPRVSPDGKFVAFLDHRSQDGDDGEVALVDRSGRKRTLSGGWASVEGLAWSPRTGEIWFAATTVREG
ncbi:MAG: protein kinase, partial [Acidobacteriota bacterium]|nr:protein kinase [Acidobacteriota bacterium]